MRPGRLVCQQQLHGWGAAKGGLAAGLSACVCSSADSPESFTLQKKEGDSLASSNQVSVLSLGFCFSVCTFGKGSDIL